MTLANVPTERWIAAAAILVVAVAGSLLCVPAVRGLRADGVRLYDLRTRIAHARQIATEVSGQQRALDVSRARYEDLERRLRESQSVALVLEALSAQARQHGVELIAQQSRSSGQQMPALSFGPSLRLRGVPVSVQLEGRYRQIGDFLGALPAAPFVAEVDHVTLMRQEPGSPRLRAEVLLMVYLPEPESGA